MSTALLIQYALPSRGVAPLIFEQGSEVPLAPLVPTPWVGDLRLKLFEGILQWQWETQCELHVHLLGIVDHKLTQSHLPLMSCNGASCPLLIKHPAYWSPHSHTSCPQITVHTKFTPAILHTDQVHVSLPAQTYMYMYWLTEHSTGLNSYICLCHLSLHVHVHLHVHIRYICTCMYVLVSLTS